MGGAHGRGGCSHPLLGCAGARGGRSAGGGAGVLPPRPPRDEAQAVPPGRGWHRVLDAGGGEGPLGAWGGGGRGGFLLLVRPFVIKAKSNLSLCLLLLGGALPPPCPVPRFPRAPQPRHRGVLLAVVFRGGRRRLLGGAALHPEPAPPGAAPAPGGRAGVGKLRHGAAPRHRGPRGAVPVSLGGPRVPGGAAPSLTSRCRHAGPRGSPPARRRPQRPSPAGGLGDGAGRGGAAAGDRDGSGGGSGAGCTGRGGGSTATPRLWLAWERRRGWGRGDPH